MGRSNLLKAHTLPPSVEKEIGNRIRRQHQIVSIFLLNCAWKVLTLKYLEFYCYFTQFWPAHTHCWSHCAGHIVLWRLSSIQTHRHNELQAFLLLQSKYLIFTLLYHIATFVTICVITVTVSVEMRLVPCFELKKSFKFLKSAAAGEKNQSSSTSCWVAGVEMLSRHVKSENQSFKWFEDAQPEIITVINPKLNTLTTIR